MTRRVLTVTVLLVTLAGTGLWWMEHTAAQAQAPSAAAWPADRPDGQPDVQGLWRSTGQPGGSHGINIEPLENATNHE